MAGCSGVGWVMCGETKITWESEASGKFARQPKQRPYLMGKSGEGEGEPGRMDE